MSKVYRRPTLPESPTNEDAVAYVQGLVRWMGPGFHPDTDFTDYTLTDGSASFPAEDAAALNAELARAVAVLDATGEDVYEIGLAVQRRIIHGTRRKR